MKHFLDVAEDLLLGGRLDEGDQRQFRAVFKGMHQLEGALAKGTMDLRNIESVFAAFEMAELLNVGQLQVDGVRLTEAIRRLIVVTLERNMPYSLVRGDPGPRPSAEYDDLARMVDDLRKGNQPVTVITFNYDAALDYAMGKFIPQAYCLEANDSPLVHLLKLHGSLNWAKWHSNAENKDYTICRTFGRRVGDGWARAAGDKVTMNLGSTMSQFNPQPSIPGKTEPLPFIVPPTWSKREHHEQIAKVWQVAAKDLGQADKIFVLGYSLPPTDHFFRYLFALGATGETRIKRFVVSDPAIRHDPELQKRFVDLLGPLARERFECWEYRFGEAVGHIRSSLLP
jgi:hypothetical protein